MSGISDDLQTAIENFERKNKLPAEMAANLRACIESSPELAERMNLAVAKNHLKVFALMDSNDPSAGALYEDGTVKIPPPALVSTPGKAFDIHDMAFVLGHEIQHGFNNVERAQAVAAAIKDMNRIARSKTEDSYDGPTAAWQQAARTDEAKASLAGWNAAASQLRHEGKAVTPETMYRQYPGRARDFIDEIREGPDQYRYQPKQGIVFKQDMSVDVEDAANIAALGKYYYDNDQKTVGYAKSTYANYTGATIISHAIDRERYNHSDRMTIDLARHGMSEPELERNGISLGRHLDSKSRQPYIDTSYGQQRQGHFDHTYDARVSADQVHQYVPIAPAMSAPGHPVHDLQATLKRRLPPETSEDRLIQIAAACHLQKFRPEQIGSIAASGSMLYIRSTGPDPGQRVNVDLTAPPPTQQQTMQQVEKHDTDQALLQAQWQSEQQQINERARQGPAHSL